MKNLKLSIMKQSKIINLTTAAYLQASQAYSIVFWSDGETYLQCRPLKKYAPKLLQNGWCRIHRSYLVNPDFIKNISDDRESIYLQNGKALPISRRNLKSVLAWKNCI
jgi:two-component system, LytTR family, response regulator